MMTGLIEIREHGRRTVTVLVMLSAAITVAVLLAFQVLRMSVLKSSERISFVALVTVFGIVFVLNGAVAGWGARWFWQRSRCPACSAFLNRIFIPEEGICPRCGKRWNLKTESTR